MWDARRGTNGRGVGFSLEAREGLSEGLRSKLEAEEEQSPRVLEVEGSRCAGVEAGDGRLGLAAVTGTDVVSVYVQQLHAGRSDRGTESGRDLPSAWSQPGCPVGFPNPEPVCFWGCIPTCFPCGGGAGVELGHGRSSQP